MNRSLLSIGLFLICTLLSGVVSAESFVTYYHTDGTGSPVAATDETGDVIWRKTYRPYGQTQSKDWDNRRGFTGHVEDYSGLVYAGGRYYNPEIGRFMSVDPVGFVDSNSQSFNRYAYANNNPYKYVDPDGRYIETAWDVFNIALGVSSFKGNIDTGNYGAAAIDAVGIIADGVAAATPLPGGAGSIIRGAKGIDSVADVAKSGAEGIGFARGQLQHAFKHADDFGVAGNPNNKTLAEYSSAIQSHIAAPGTQVIQGSYRDQTVTHFVDPSSGLNVIRDASGNFLSGWKLSPQQLEHVLTSGKLGGG